MPSFTSNRLPNVNMTVTLEPMFEASRATQYVTSIDLILLSAPLEFRFPARFGISLERIGQLPRGFVVVATSNRHSNRRRHAGL